MIIRVFAVDGPYRGLQYMDVDTGRLLLHDDRPDRIWYVYRLIDGEIAHTDFGPCPAAHFDRTKPAPHLDLSAH